jgi:protein gp37
MADASPIEWTDATWNPVRGCTRVSPGCGGPGHAGGCYAEAVAARFSDPGQPYHGFAERGRTGSKWTGKVALIEEQLDLPLRWRKPRRIFVNSMSDLFHESLSDAAIDRVFAVMAAARQHTFQVLTKRAARMREYLSRYRPSPAWDGFVTRDGVSSNESPPGAPMFSPQRWPLPNVWLGVSVEDQARADERIPDLLETPAALRFLSCEPLLGPVDLRNLRRYNASGRPWIDALGGVVTRGDHLARSPSECSLNTSQQLVPRGPRIGWVIAGGESGPRARPMHPDWARSLRDQCAAARVPFFLKQWGEHMPVRDILEAMSLRRPSGAYDRDGKLVPEAIAMGPNPPVVSAGDWQLMSRVGKKRAGRILDGRAHDDFPTPLKADR